MMNRLKRLLIVTASLLIVHTCPAQTPATKDASQLFYQLRDKIGVVKDYVADVKMKIDVAFMRVPLLAGKLYFKAPSKLKLERNGGISILPKKSYNLTLSNLIPAGQATVIDIGVDKIGDRQVRVLQVVPQEETDIVLTKVWVDEARLLVLRSETTTRENGTVRMELEFGRYAQLALPDHVIFKLDIKDYKLPKGVTMDYDDGTQEMMAQAKKMNLKKGTIEIRYLSYQINTGLSDAIFEAKK
jgi:outer membrane lipoprotein-sorting protein